MDDDSTRSGPPVSPTQRGHEVIGGEKRRRMPVQDPSTAAEMNQFPNDKRRVPYDVSELISSSERPAQRYSLLDQRCYGQGGLDFDLLRKCSVHLLEALLRDMYVRLKVLDAKYVHQTKELEDTRKQNDYLKSRMTYAVEHYTSLHASITDFMHTKSKLEDGIEEFRRNFHPTNTGDPPGEAVPIGDAAVGDTLPQAPSIDEASALLDGQILSENDLEKLRIHVLGKGTVRLKGSSSGTVEKALHGMHLRPVDSSSEIDEGIYYFQRELLDIFNTILPKRLKVSSLGAWNYAIRNIRTEVLQSATWDDTSEAAEARKLATGSKGVILLTHNTVRDVIANLTERTQDDQKWDRVPDKVNKQNALKLKTDDLVIELDNIMGLFHDRMMDNRDVSDT